jgi:hypothetical protein
MQRVAANSGGWAEVPGYCESTHLGEGSQCEPRQRKGSWVVSTTAECVRLCQGCPQCRFITRYTPLKECSWFSACAGFSSGRLRQLPGKHHRTSMVRHHNGSFLVRAPALLPPRWAATFASVSCASADLLEEEEWIRFYRSTSAFAAMTLVTTADDPCPLCAWTHLTLPRRGQPWGHWVLRAQREAWRAHLHDTVFDYYVYLRPDMTWFVPPPRLLVLLRPDGRRLIYSPNHAFGNVPTPEWGNESTVLNDRVAIMTRGAAPRFFNRAHRLETDVARGNSNTERLLRAEMLDQAVVVKTFPTLAAVRCCANLATCAGRKALSGKHTTCVRITVGGELNFTAKYPYEAFAAATYAEGLLRRGAQLKPCPRGVCLQPSVLVRWQRILRARAERSAHY